MPDTLGIRRRGGGPWIMEVYSGTGYPLGRVMRWDRCPRGGIMHKRLPYIEPTIRSIAGTFIMALGLLLHYRYALAWLWLPMLFFIGINLFQSGFTRFCMMEKLLKWIGFRSELDEIRALSKQAQESAALQANYLDTLNLLSEAVIELSPDGLIESASDGWAKLLGQDDNQNADRNPSIGQSISVFLGGLDHEVLRELLEDLGHDGGRIINKRFKLKDRQRHERWVEGKFTLSRQASGGPRIKGILRDVTDYLRQEREIRRMALHDALTNLPNRILLEDRMEHALAQARRLGHKAGLLFIDLDNFKQVNDIYGHKAGDRLLVAVSDSLKRALRDGDTLARWGGDEFVVLIPALCDTDDLRRIVDKLIAGLNEELSAEHAEAYVTISVGVAVFPDDARSSEALLVQADKALYFAKSQGRNNVQYFSELKSVAGLGYHDVDITSRFTAAVRRREIQVAYQPLVDARSGRIVCIEALARWQDTEQGWVSPATFIPIAENLGLIHEVGRQVLERALGDFSACLRSDAGIRLAVNISNRQLFAKDFMSDILSLIERHRIEPWRITLEITESIALHGLAKAKQCLMALSGAGFKLSIDDFGTGYSSLSNLHQLPVDELKIDMGFVKRIHAPDGRIMVETIVRMGRAMRVGLVAEGVEDADSARLLAEMGVDVLQGYHFSKPLPREQCVGLIEKCASATDGVSTVSRGGCEVSASG